MSARKLESPGPHNCFLMWQLINAEREGSVDVLPSLMARTWALFLRACLPIYKSLVRRRTSREVRESMWNWTFSFQKFYEEITFSLFTACVELHRNMSVRTEMISRAT